MSYFLINDVEKKFQLNSTFFSRTLKLSILTCPVLSTIIIVCSQILTQLC